jgi:hypothetical protein
MKSTLLLLFSTLFFSILLPAQNRFQKAIGGVSDDKAYSLVQTRDKGFIMGGYSYSQGIGGSDCYLLKTDSNGVFLWGKTYGGPRDDEGYIVQQTADDGYIFCGYTKSFGAGAYDVYLIRTDPNGDTLWTKTYGGPLDDFGNAMQQTADGGFIIGGYTVSYSYNVDSGNAYILKLDAGGNLQWSRTFSGPNEITDVYAIAQTPDHGYAMTGYSNAFGEPNGDAFLAKTDSLGIVQYIRTYGFKGYDWGNAIIPTPDGGYMIGGTYSTDSTSADLDVYLIKTNTLGDTLFTKTYGGVASDFCQSMVPTPGGGFALVGYTRSFGNGNYDALFMQTNATGDTLKTRTYGGTDDDEANSVVVCSDGTYAMAGFANSFGAGAADVLVIKTDGSPDCNTHSFSAPRKHSTSVVGSHTASVSASTPTITSRTHTTILPVGQEINPCDNIGIAPLKEVQTTVALFPNPSSGSCMLAFANPKITDYLITVSDILGKQVLSFNFKGKSQYENQLLNLADLTSGVYFIHLVSGDYRTSVKVVLEKK